MNVCLVLELLGQVLQALKPHQLGQEPFLETLLTEKHQKVSVVIVRF